MLLALIGGRAREIAAVRGRSARPVAARGALTSWKRCRLPLAGGPPTESRRAIGSFGHRALAAEDIPPRREIALDWDRAALAAAADLCERLASRAPLGRGTVRNVLPMC